MADFMDWPLHKREILVKLVSDPRPIKIAVKVKDDFGHLRNFLDHYGDADEQIGLVFMDNMSSDRRTKELLQEQSLGHTVFQFRGFLDKVHDSRFFSDLHSALSQSSRYWGFMDVDELVVWIDSDLRVSRGAAMAHRILSQESPFIPGIWIENKPLTTDEFYLDLSSESGIRKFLWGIRSGKPLINSQLKLAKANYSRIHNFQYVDNLRQKYFLGNLFVLHMRNLDPNLRIAGNLNKLRGRNLTQGVLERFGISGGKFALEDLLEAVGHEELTGSAGKNLKEIQRLMQAEEEIDSPSRSYFKLNFGHFSSESIDNIEKLAQFIESPCETIGSVLGPYES